MTPRKIERWSVATLWLQNPDKFVLSATIAENEIHGGYWLVVRTCYSSGNCDHYKSVLAAKMDFGKKFKKGGKWGPEIAFREQ
jgi:hypothetical protein